MTYITHALICAQSYNTYCLWNTALWLPVESVDCFCQDEKIQQDRQDEDEQRRGVLFETLFDPLLSAPEVASLPVAFELGSEAGEAQGYIHIYIYIYIYTQIETLNFGYLLYPPDAPTPAPRIRCLEHANMQ